MTRSVPVTFAPSGAVAWVVPGTTVLSASRIAGIAISSPCGGRGICGACGIKVLEGWLDSPDADEQAGLARAKPGVRLACCARVAGAVTVRPLVSLGTVTPTPSAARFEESDLAAGVDLGTTNVSALVIDTATGREVGRATVPNRQRTHGADVLSRVSSALEGEADALRVEAEDSVVEALDLATGGLTDRVSRLVVAGNTVMSALLVGADVTPLASAPFEAPGLSGHQAGVRLTGALAARSTVILMLPVAGFVGGDVSAGLVALGVLDSDEPALLVDVGTNAEVALWTGKRLYVASTAAGPAFEGTGGGYGGPAAPGAITRVRLGKGHALSLETVGGIAGSWFSGSGFVSLIALLRRIGHLDAEGVLRRSGPLADHFSTDPRGVTALRIGEGDDGAIVTQLDIRELQLAKGAVRAAVESVLVEAGVEASMLARVHVAGVFGGAMEPVDLVELGVVPRQVSKVLEAPGNASLIGASMAALDEAVLDAAKDAAAAAVHVDLAESSDFGDRFVRALQLAPFDA